MKPVRVLIVDDHEVVRVGLQTVLSRQDSIKVVGEAANVTDAVVECCRLQPDVVLMDVRLPGGSGVDACRAIMDSCPATRVLFLSSYQDDEAVLAAVRSATVGMPGGQAAAAPLRHGRFLFSHNGSLDDWPSTKLAATLPPERLIQLEAPTDSALLWALVVQRLAAGTSLGRALTEVVTEAGDGRLNLLLTDGATIAATRWGASLWFLETDTGVVVASEPHGPATGWSEVPERHLLVAADRRAEVTPI
jgi:CheY-like chemotaxis protein